MSVRTRIWARAMARGLFVATSLTATPAVACPGPSVAELAGRLPASGRFDYPASQLRPFLSLWDERGGSPLPAPPDGVALFVQPGRPILIAFGQAGCLLALLPTRPADLWHALRQHLGRVA